MTTDELEALPICEGHMIDCWVDGDTEHMAPVSLYEIPLSFAEGDFARIHDSRGIAWATGTARDGRRMRIRVHGERVVAVLFGRLVELARECPREYGLRFADWSGVPAVKALSAALAKAGYLNTSKAVLNGKGWPHSVACARDETSLRYIEEHASEPGWSWMRETTKKAT